jgi:hypothetical protein
VIHFGSGSFVLIRTGISRIVHTSLCWIAVAASLFLASATPAQTTTQESFEYDIVIRGGRVLDGAGNPCIFADVAIKDAS